MGLFSKLTSYGLPQNDCSPKQQVVTHLQYLFRSKKGFSYFQHDFGLDCSEGDLYNKQFILKLKSDIEQVVKQYETRLILHDVEIISCREGISFCLNGMIEQEKCTLYFVLEGR